MIAVPNQRLFHATGAECLASIAKDGLRARSYWSADESLTAYYRETVADEGRDPVLLVIDLAQLQALDANLLQPDLPGIDEPITSAIDQSEDEVQEAWKSSGQDWAASLAIVKSLRFDGVIPPSMLYVLEGEHDLLPLTGGTGVPFAPGWLPSHMIQTAAGGATLWVNSGKDGSAIGRFSKSFGIDVHTTGTEQIASGVECLLCTHEPAGVAEFERFCSAMREHHGIVVPSSSMRFDDAVSLSKRARPVC